MIPPENIGKPLVFWCFQEVSKETKHCFCKVFLLRYLQGSWLYLSYRCQIHRSVWNRSLQRFAEFSQVFFDWIGCPNKEEDLNVFKKILYIWGKVTTLWHIPLNLWTAHDSIQVFLNCLCSLLPIRIEIDWNIDWNVISCI